MDAARSLIRTFTSPGFGQNAYLVDCGAIVRVAIDPGAESPRMADLVEAEGARLEAILLTHAHLDHVEGVAALVARTGAPTYLHPGDRPLYERASEQGAAFGVRIDPLPPIDHPLEHEQTLRFGDRSLRVLHVPGHSPGHVLLHDAAAAIAFVGDVVFMGSIGRTDLPGGDFQQLMRSIRERVLTLPDDTRLLCGHGPETTVRRERDTNPFLVPQFGGGRA